MPAEKSRESKILSGKDETKRGQTSERNVRRRRQIDPNKVVHIEDTGKRLSQHYTDGKVTVDSDRAFGDEKKLCSNGNCVPKGSECPKLSRNNSEAYEVTFREQTIGDRLKHLEGINDRKIKAEIMRNVVNNEALTEYREKYTKRLPHNKAEGENFEWKSTVKKEYSKKTYVPKHCEACDIERFWAD